VSVRENQEQVPFGFNVLGHISGNLGLAVACRNTIHMLSACGESVCVVDIDAGGGRSGHDLTYQHLACGSKPPPFAINLIHLNPPDVVNAMVDDRRMFDPVTRVNACVPFWELTYLPEQYWVPVLNNVDLVLAPTRYILDTVNRSCPDAVAVHYPQAVFLPADVRPNRARWHIPADAIAFLMVIDVASDLERKNPRAALEAFRMAFPPEADSNARLVVKLNNSRISRNFSRETDELIASLKSDPRVTTIEDRLSYADVLSLNSSCDVYVSLHRAEGLGLNLMEAMSLGKAVIATAWSGNMDYMTEENSCLVGHTLVPVTSNHPTYVADAIGENQMWAEPDVTAAAQWMQRLAEDAPLRLRLGQAASQTMDRAREVFLQGGAISAIRDLWDADEVHSQKHAERAAQLLALRKIGPYRMTRRRVGTFLRKTGLRP